MTSHSRAGKTQEELADKLGCTQGTISKLENSGIDGIKVSDLVAYAQACDLNLTIAFHEEQSAVESVKGHVFAIKDHLDHLAQLAQGDQDIFDGVRAFYGISSGVTIPSCVRNAADAEPLWRSPVFRGSKHAERIYSFGI